MYRFLNSFSFVLGMVLSVYAVSAHASDIYYGPEEAYSIDASLFDKIDSTSVKVSRVKIAPMIKALLIVSSGRGYKVEYHIIGPFGRPKLNILDVISKSLDGVSRIKNKQFIECEFGRCLSYYNLMRHNNKARSVEASLLFVKENRVYHLSATTFNSSLFNKNEFIPTATKEAQQELDFLLPLIKFRSIASRDVDDYSEE